ncbi:hypothetical protein ACFL59_00260 [Planctomycetota bacterium]
MLTQPRVCTRAFLLSAALVALVCCSGCSVGAQHLRQHPIAYTEVLPASAQTNHKILIYPLDDLRGGEFLYIFPSSFIPVVNFFHAGNIHRFPEQSAMLRSTQGTKPMVMVGALDSAFPAILARSIRALKLSNQVVPIEEVNVKTELSSFDYVVRGKLKNSKLTTHINFVPCALLAILGAPVLFVNYDLELEISAFGGSDPATPVFTKAYYISESKVAGLYYNHNAYYDLFLETLEQTTVKVVKDLAKALKGGGSYR